MIVSWCKQFNWGKLDNLSFRKSINYLYILVVNIVQIILRFVDLASWKIIINSISCGNKILSSHSDHVKFHSVIWPFHHEYFISLCFFLSFIFWFSLFFICIRFWACFSFMPCFLMSLKIFYSIIHLKMLSYCNKWMRNILFSFVVNTNIKTLVYINRASFWSMRLLSIFRFVLSWIWHSIIWITFKFANLFTQLLVRILINFRVNIFQLLSISEYCSFLD